MSNFDIKSGLAYFSVSGYFHSYDMPHAHVGTGHFVKKFQKSFWQSSGYCMNNKLWGGSNTYIEEGRGAHWAKIDLKIPILGVSMKTHAF